MRSASLALLLKVGALVVRAQFDVILSQGKIVDGTGNPWFYADIGIRGDQIAAIGKLDSASAKERLNVRGLVVAPGFIDIHSHSRRAIFDSPSAENLLRQGVTTVIEGNDGSSPLPLGPFLERLGPNAKPPSANQTAELSASQQLTGASPRQPPAGATPIAVNFGSFVGHGSIREQVLGLANRPATPEELERQKELVRQAMSDGAFGLSTGLFYIPGNFTPLQEVVELARTAGEMGGIHISHIRNEADGLLESVRETIAIGEKALLPTQVTHHKAVGKANWGKTEETLRIIEQARTRGVDVSIDQYPYTASSTGSAALFPRWALEGGRQAFLERLQAPQQRERILAETVHIILHDRGGGDPKNVVLASCSFDHSLDGKSLADIAAARGRPPTADNAALIAVEIERRGGCATIYHAISEQDVERVLKHPLTMTASDGGVMILGEGVPHPRNYGTFPRVLARYVRERKLISLEEAVRKMSAYPAARLGLWDRGLIRPGMKADLVVFDESRITDQATFEQPHQYAEGVHHVLVNGALCCATAREPERCPGSCSGAPLIPGRSATSDRIASV
jgi:dihydroorotase/N-acyl-D-amino-acid deacylase